MSLLFLGTCSAQPSLTRNHSALAITFPSASDCYLFDCGEATQHQLLKSPIKTSRISKIFITHLHGDHCFGLPGLVSTLLQQRQHVDVYGPEGIKFYLRNVLLGSLSRLGGTISIFELSHQHPVTDEPHSDELLQSNILPNNGTWTVSTDDQCTIYAREIKHTIPCLGYVVQQHASQGRLRIEELKPQFEKFKQEYKKMKLNPMTQLSGFKSGQSIVLPDGSVLESKDYLDPPVPGKKIVVLGDTCDPWNMQDLSMGCDILIHEATNAKLSSDPETEEQVQQTTIQHGHSTPQMAGRFAKAIGAKKVYLNHFSHRYKGDDSEEAIQVMQEIRQLCVLEYGSDQVVTARDLDCFAL
ncbi:Metallo-hydrolase/oxidoreductase [Gorgonomyces haynaldii]|nr:Metallo-hydrolase/oxidoreductase [Gorgonomyces haynaldii]